MSKDIFLKIDGIEGESLDSTHGKEIEVNSFSWGMSQGANIHTGSGGGAGKVSINDLSINRDIDKSSPMLMQVCMTGKPAPKAVLTVRKAGDNPLEYYKITMTEVMVSNIQIGSSGDGSLSESISLAFSRVKIEYQPQGADGAASGGAIITEYDIKAGTRV